MDDGAAEPLGVHLTPDGPASPSPRPRGGTRPLRLRHNRQPRSRALAPARPHRRCLPWCAARRRRRHALRPARAWSISAALRSVEAAARPRGHARSIVPSRPRRALRLRRRQRRCHAQGSPHRAAPARAGASTLRRRNASSMSTQRAASRAPYPEIPEAIRGTFAGLAHPAAIAHLKRLGVTHVELMPAAAWADERQLAPLGLTNHWGYNPVAWMAPDPRLAPRGMAEVRTAVAALAEAESPPSSTWC